MTQRTITTRSTLHITKALFSLLICINTPHIAAQPKKLHLALVQTTVSPSHKCHREPDSEPRTLRDLVQNAPRYFLNKHEEKLLHAIDLFHGVPGFASTLKKALNQARQSPLAHGYMYEIETALTMQEINGDPVCSFGKEHLSSQAALGNHEIDVETRHFHIECKDIYWHSPRLLADPEKIERQLLEQQALIDEENQRTDRPKLFLLCSRNPIPTEWCTWLEENNIAYACPAHDTSSSDEETSSMES